MLRILLIFLMITAAIFEVRQAFPAKSVQQLLPNLQRQGSCADLPQFGVSTHQGRNPDDVNVKLISESRARVVRFDVPWNDVEHEGQYNFSAYDDLIRKLRASGKSIVLVLAYGHPDHSDGRAENGLPLPPHTPEQRAAYGRYVQSVARQYHGPDIIYEIWNEPNITLFWPPAPDAKAYAELLAEATHAIRSIEPAATIISAGLANVNDPAGYLHTLAKTGALDQLDGITFHPYRQNGPENSINDIDEFENATAGRASHPLWITEWGYSEAWIAKTDPAHIQQRLAVMTARLMLTAALAKAKTTLVYELIDDGTSPSDQESNFGLYDYDFQPKPAATAFRSIAELMSDCNKYKFKVDKTLNIRTATFYFDRAVSYVVWTYEAAPPRDICLTTDGAHPIDSQDVLGNRLPIQSCGTASQVELRVSDESGPIILQAEISTSK